MIDNFDFMDKVRESLQDGFFCPDSYDSTRIQVKSVEWIGWANLLVTFRNGESFMLNFKKQEQ